MATVYLAIQEIFERQVALKVMDVRLAEDPTFGQRFLREAKIVSQVMHPNIVTVFDVGVHENFYYFSMEYIAGLDLKTGYHLLTLEEKIQIIVDVAQALAFAASKGYVHRDIKVENILLREQNRQAVLMDFGIARTAAGDMSVTQTGAALGTPHYMSPEQASGGAIDHRSDLYSLGIVFYYLLMGFVPYRGDSAVSVGIKHLTAPIPKLPNELQDLQPILDSLLAKSPELRFQSADELIKYLQGLDLIDLAEKARVFSRQQLSGIDGELKDRTTGEHDTTLVDELDSLTLKHDFPAVDKANQVSVSSQLKNSKKIVLWMFCFSAALIAVVFLRNFWPRSVAPAATLTEAQSFAEFDWPDLTTVDDASNMKASNNRILKKLNSSIKDLAHKFQQDDPSIEDQERVLRQKIAQMGLTPELQQQLQRLEKLAFAEVFAVLNEGDFQRGSYLLERYQELFAEAWHSHIPLRKNIEQLLANAPELESFQALAQLAVREKRYIAPEGENALLQYQKMLQLQPQFGGAINGLRILLSLLQNDAEESYQSGSWGRAYGYAKTILILNPADGRAQQMVLEIEQYQQQENELTEWLRRAEQLFLEGKLFAPKHENAYELLQKILSIRPDHFQAKTAMSNLKTQFREAIQLQVNAGARDEAETELLAALSVASEDRELIELRDLILEEHAMDSSAKPVIERLIVADSEIVTLGASQERRLRIQKTLYGAIAYRGFGQKNQILVAQLMDDSGGLLDQLSLVISSANGEQRFRIDHAIDNFSEGRYRLRLLLEGAILIETKFTIGN